MDHPKERRNDVRHTTAESTAVMCVVGPVDDVSVLLLKEFVEHIFEIHKKKRTNWIFANMDDKNQWEAVAAEFQPCGENHQGGAFGAIIGKVTMAD